MGGIPAIENSWPWQVLIKGKNETSGANWTCGGVILFENVIKISWTTISVKLIFFFYNLRFILSGFSLLDTVLVEQWFLVIQNIFFFVFVFFLTDRI